MIMKVIPVFLMGALAAIAGCSCSNQSSSPNISSGPSLTASPLSATNAAIGVTIFTFDNTFMTGVRNAIAAAGEGHAAIEIVDSRNSQPKQNDQVDKFIAKKVRALAINPVDRTAAGVIIEKAKAADIPVVFFNRQPLADDLNKWNKLYYVGAKAEQSGSIEGEIIADHWKKHPEMDKNKDGVLQYVMLKGEPGHQDTELRTKFSIKAVQDAGIKVERLQEDTAMWGRAKSQEKMAAFLAAEGDKIEAVFANNDDMALGAIEALKAKGYFKDGRFMPVVGVDATAPALKALAEGTLLGTVLNDMKSHGSATFKVAYALAQGQTPNKENTGYDIADGKYIWIPYKKITKDNLNDAKF